MAKIIGKDNVLRFKPFEGEPKPPVTLEEALVVLKDTNERLSALEKRNKDLLHETMQRKEKIQLFEKEKTDLEEARLKKEGEYKTLVETYEPKAKRLDSVITALDEIFNLEIADVPADKRDLIPTGNVEERLKWVKQAKAKKLFGEPPAPKVPPPPSDPTKPGGTTQTPEFCSWAPDDPRMLKLTTDQYKVWKEHNRKAKDGVKGWGG